MTEKTKRTIIVHGHIFKNAGSTFDWSLARNFGKNFIDHRDTADKKERSAGYLSSFIDAHAGLQAIASHHLYRWMPLPERSAVELVPCFLLRHPLERVRSVYNFERRQKVDTPGAVVAKKLNFRDYIKWRMDHKGGGVVMDYQLRYCSGRKGVELDRELLSGTVDYLNSRALTGIVDRYDESMVYFEDALGGIFPGIDLSYVKQNVSEEALASTSVTEKVAAVMDEMGDVAAELEHNNKADIDFYTHMNSALDKRLDGITDFAVKLENFRNRCGKLNKKSWF